MRRALRVHPLRIHLVFQGLTAVVALGCAGVLSVDGTGWVNWPAFWAALGAVGQVWTQLAWGPCWGAGADYGLTAGVRIALMAAAGGALLLPFLVLNVFLDTVWFLYGLVLAPYGLIMGLLGGTVLAIRGSQGHARLTGGRDLEGDGPVGRLTATRSWTRLLSARRSRGSSATARDARCGSGAVGGLDSWVWS